MTRHSGELDAKRFPGRGEIWFVELPTDPPGKGPRPVVIVSVDGRNRNVRADTVSVAPLTPSIQKNLPTHIYLPAGETGLLEDSCVRAEDITVVRKATLREPRFGLRRLAHSRICQVVAAARISMGC